MQFTFGFLAKKIIAAMLLPPVLPLVVILIGLLITVRKRRLGLAFAWLGLLLGLFLSTPVTVSLLTRPLENFTPALLAGGCRHAGHRHPRRRTAS